MYHYDRGECQTHSSLLWLLRGERRGEEREPKLSFRPEESKGEKEEKGLRQTAAKQSLMPVRTGRPAVPFCSKKVNPPLCHTAEMPSR